MRDLLLSFNKGDFCTGRESNACRGRCVGGAVEHSCFAGRVFLERFQERGGINFPAGKRGVTRKFRGDAFSLLNLRVTALSLTPEEWFDNLNTLAATVCP